MQFYEKHMKSKSVTGFSGESLTKLAAKSQSQSAALYKKRSFTTITEAKSGSFVTPSLNHNLESGTNSRPDHRLNSLSQAVLFLRQFHSRNTLFGPSKFNRRLD